MMGTLRDWLAGLSGQSSDRVDRRRDERLAAFAIQPADFDPVTGALRTDRFMAMMALEQAARPGVLLLVDMSQRLTALSSRYPDADREALVLMALAIRQAIRFDDLVSHIEGYRFAVLLRGAPQELAHTIAQRICESIDDTVFLISDGIAQVDVAVGGAVFELGDAQDLHAEAQSALDAARRSHSGRIAIGRA